MQTTIAQLRQGALTKKSNGNMPPEQTAIGNGQIELLDVPLGSCSSSDVKPQ
jgi:hypothetical protein